MAAADQQQAGADKKTAAEHSECKKNKIDTGGKKNERPEPQRNKAVQYECGDQRNGNRADARSFFNVELPDNKKKRAELDKRYEKAERSAGRKQRILEFCLFR